MAGILIVFVFYSWHETIWHQCHFSLPFMYGYYLWEAGGRGVVSIQCLVLWWCSTKEQEPFMRALQNVLHCPILFPREALVPVCLQRNVIFLLSFWRWWNVFGELISIASLFLSNSMLKEEMHFRSSSTGPGFAKMLFFASTGMDAPGSFAFVTQHLTCHNLHCASVCCRFRSVLTRRGPNNSLQSNNGSYHR